MTTENKETKAVASVETVRVLQGGILIKGVGTVARGLTIQLEATHAAELEKKKLVRIIH